MKRFTSRLRLGIALLLAALATAGYCAETSDHSKHRGQGAAAGAAQSGDWQARRAAAAATAAAGDMAQHPHGHAGAADSPDATGQRDAGNRGRSGRMGGSGPWWLAEAPPKRGDGARGGARRGSEGMEGMDGMAMGGARGGAPGKRVWLRAGNDPQASGLAPVAADVQPEILLVAPDGKPQNLALPPEWRQGLAFEMPVQGYYRVYCVNRKLQGETLNIDVAKAEITNFRHGGDPAEAERALAAPRMLATVPLEIVRERQPDEKLYFQLKSGIDQAFVVLQQGQPLPGARVRFISHQGWVKEAVSDAQGRVSFQVVRDYFPPWEEFQKRFKATYLVIAEASAAEAGDYQGQAYSGVRYRSSLSGSYYPSPNDYLSYAWGLGLGVGLVLFCGVAVYLYRRRRVKPFREVRFNEN